MFFSVVHSLFFCIIAVRNLSFTETEFNLFTAYNASGQENITDEDDKEKIMVQPIIESIEKCTKEQLEDIVNGWMRHIKKVFKLYEQKVVNSCAEYANRILNKRTRRSARTYFH